MNTPVYDSLAFQWDYDVERDCYWTAPWLAFCRIADDINRIGVHRHDYRPFIVALLFHDVDGNIQGMAL